VFVSSPIPDVWFHKSYNCRTGHHQPLEKIYQTPNHRSNAKPNNQSKKRSKESMFSQIAKAHFCAFLKILIPPIFKPHNFPISYSFQTI
jgi:hypothetical protein